MLGRWIPEEKLAAASAWIEKRGINVVLVSRFTPGLRLPTYLAAGLLRSRFWAFAGYFLLASALWTPLLVGGTAVFGEQVARQSPVPAVVLVFALLAAGQLRQFESRRRFVGFLKRRVQWEFWPMWATYLPLVPYLVFLAIKHRSLTLFTAANPGIPSGGLVGESKSQILRHLSQVAEFTLVPASSAVPRYGNSSGAEARCGRTRFRSCHRPEPGRSRCLPAKRQRRHDRAALYPRLRIRCLLRSRSAGSRGAGSLRH